MRRTTPNPNYRRGHRIGRTSPDKSKKQDQPPLNRYQRKQKYQKDQKQKQKHRIQEQYLQKKKGYLYLRHEYPLKEGHIHQTRIKNRGKRKKVLQHQLRQLQYQIYSLTPEKEKNYANQMRQLKKNKQIRHKKISTSPQTTS